MARKQGLRVGWVAGSILRRSLAPRHLRHLVRGLLGRSGGVRLTAFDNPQLRLYSRILPGGFLHYGYFEDPSVAAADLSLGDLERAQLRYAERVLELVTDSSAPVLDVGAGMGGLSRMLAERGFSPVALTPDRHQVRHIRSTQPGVPVIEGRFHEVDWQEHIGHFGTVVTAESFQYLVLDHAVATCRRILRPGGRWVICDYFRTGPEASGSGHVWSEFEAAAAAEGWRIERREDITAHVVPTLGFVRMLGDRFGLPIVDFLGASLRRKRPALHYVLEETLERVEQLTRERLAEVDPERFFDGRRYLLLALERATA